MTAIVEVIRPNDDGSWRVAVDGRCIVAFYGEGAQQLAQYHRDALEELLADNEGSRQGVRVGASPAMAADALGQPIGFRSIFPNTIN
jgi:hypothetical protein